MRKDFENFFYQKSRITARTRETQLRDLQRSYPATQCYNKNQFTFRLGTMDPWEIPFLVLLGGWHYVSRLSYSSKRFDGAPRGNEHKTIT
jgi:hypothetical protein